MLTLPSSVKIFIYSQPTDMRCGFNKLSMFAESFMRKDPFSGHLFVFFSKTGDKCKILFWDRTGFIVWYKQLQEGAFEKLPCKDNQPSVDVSVIFHLSLWMMIFHLLFSFSMTAKTQITAATSIEQLPTNVSTLQQMVLTLLGQIDDLQGQLYYLKRQLFGKKSEKLSPDQRLLFENLYNEIEAKIEQQRQPKPEPVQKRKKNENHKGRNPLPADLRREIIPIEPSEEEKFCDRHDKPKTFIGTEQTEKLEYLPASFFVKVYVRSKYVRN